MELSVTPDMAAKQAIDSIRVFKEVRRLESELEELGGSMFWKVVDGYEYLIHKTGSKAQSLGPRSEETEQKYEAYKNKRAKLQTRLKQMRTTLGAMQRMNKAVHAGEVPTPIIETLLKLDALGLGKQALVLGRPAIYAYGQGSGVRVDASGDLPKMQKYWRPHDSLQLAVETGKTPARSVVLKLKDSLKGLGSVQVVSIDENKSTKKLGESLIVVITYTKKTDRGTETGAVRSFVPGSDAPNVQSFVMSLRGAPTYEQVVIGKTGEMAVMRTVDPAVFIAQNRWLDHVQPEGTDQELRHAQVELVESLLREHRVMSKASDATFNLSA